MKFYSFLISAAFLLALSSVVIIGCKYDVAEPLWDKPAAGGITVTITSIEPVQAVPGVNTITIHGSGFTGAADTSVVHNVATGRDTAIVYNGVTFNGVKAEIMECSSTSIKVRRPNLTGDSITVNIATSIALVEAKSSIYKIDPVMERYGAFLDNFQVDAVVVDSAENVYVIADAAAPCRVFQVTPGGHTQVGTTLRAPMDAKIGPDGRLYYVGNNTSGFRDIDVVNLQTGIASLWYHHASVYFTCFDFDANGFIYAGSNRTRSLLKINTTHSAISSAADYTQDSILAVRVYNGYVYSVVQRFPALTVSRSLIADTSAAVGAKELVLDLTQVGMSLRNIVKSLAFSADGSKMYIGVAGTNSILIATDAMNIPISSDRVDILYKGILPTYCKHFCIGDRMYMLSGNTSPAVPWDLYRVDVGTSGSPHY
jgi:hypothetical protein